MSLQPASPPLTCARCGSFIDAAALGSSELCPACLDRENERPGLELRFGTLVGVLVHPRKTFARANPTPATGRDLALLGVVTLTTWLASGVLTDLMRDFPQHIRVPPPAAFQFQADFIDWLYRHPISCAVLVMVVLPIVDAIATGTRSMPFLIWLRVAILSCLPFAALLPLLLILFASWLVVLRIPPGFAHAAAVGASFLLFMVMALLPAWALAIRASAMRHLLRLGRSKVVGALVATSAAFVGITWMFW